MDLPPNSFPNWNSRDIKFLGKMVTDDEIKKPLFDMAPLKALSNDGFHALFFRNQWIVVGSVICERDKKIFAGEHIDHALNNTLVTLIPKTANPKSFQQFRPISLCTTI